MSPTPTLEPISPEAAVEWYLGHKDQEVTQGTIGSYGTSLEYFIEFCENQSITNLNELNGRLIEKYRSWRRRQSTDTPLKPKTMRDEMYLIRDFVRYLESIEAVTPDLHKRVVIPKLDPGDGVRDVQLERERAERTLDHLEKFEYASLDHIVWLLFCETGRRIGGLHSLDLGDYHPDPDNPYLAFRHRPEWGTRLKNGKQSETNVNLADSVCRIIDDYLTNRRPSVDDDFGRQPLLATENGRLSKSTMRKYVYKWSRPCQIRGTCPHDREIQDCEAANKVHAASKCPSSVSPHAIRHGYISSMLNAETPKQILSERCDVSEPMIDKHYDERDEAEKQELRKRILDKVYDNGQPGYAN